MQKPDFKIGKNKSFIKILAACFIILMIGVNSFAQYKGTPVKKDRLIKALKSKQLPTEDIVTIINRNGVDFRLTEEVKKALIAAGARPEVINAVAQNQRTDNLAKSKRRKNTSETDYDELARSGDQFIQGTKKSGFGCKISRISGQTESE